MFRLPATPLALAAAGLTLVYAAPPRAAAQDGEGTRYVTVDGWAVHGYANGKEIGYTPVGHS